MTTLNHQGGFDPATKAELYRAKKADLITLPEDVKGTNCFNCKWVDTEAHYCNHPKVKQEVNNRNCCSLWDNVDTYRPWKGGIQIKV